MKNIKQLLSLLLIVFLAACQGGGKQAFKVKLAHGMDPSHPVHKAMVFMADTLESISNGEMTMEIYPSGQLGGEQQCVELLQIGSLAITKVSAAVLESFTDNYQVLGLPYVFRSREHYYNVLDGKIGAELLNSMDDFNLKGLCFYDAGARSYYTINKDITQPDDLKGLKIRVMKSQTAMSMVKAMGGAPTPISWGELYTALQSGVVDGAENNPPSFLTSRHYDVCKNYSLNEHTRVPDVLIISTVVWHKLNDKQKEYLTKAAKASVGVERELWLEAEEEALKKVIEAGVKVTYPSKEPFAAKVEALLENYKDQPQLYDLIKRIKSTH